MIKIFYSYAHEDETYLKILTDVFMKPLTRDGIIAGWHDRDISAGQEWQREIDANLDAADIIVLLVSN